MYKSAALHYHKNGNNLKARAYVYKGLKYDSEDYSLNIIRKEINK